MLSRGREIFERGEADTLAAGCKAALDDDANLYQRYRDEVLGAIDTNAANARHGGGDLSVSAGRPSIVGGDPAERLEDLARELRRDDPTLSPRDALSKAANTPEGKRLVLASKAQAEATPKTVKAATTRDANGEGRRRTPDEIDATVFEAKVQTLVAQGKTPGDAYDQARRSYPELYAAYARANTVSKAGKRGA
jgi:hypothetical protein